jgi:hypothetical protein
MFNSRILTISAREIDPLSWFTGPFVPLVFAAINLFYGGALAILTWGASAFPVAQLIGVLLCTAACVYVHVVTRPRFAAIGWGGGAIAILIAGTGFVLSAIGYADSAFLIELWWAPLGFALAIGSLAPYLPMRQLLVVGGVGTLVFVSAAFLEVYERVVYWGPLSTYLIILLAPASGLAASAAFSYVIVSRMLPLIEKRSEVLVSPRLDPAAEASERERLAAFTARAAPFLEGVARSGEVTPEDRNLAGQLARRLRDDLVTQSNISWLDTVASGSRLVIVDPEHRASRMRTAQRTALRGLLRAILDTPGTDAGSLLVDLRGQPDGATAVGISLEMELPEGRRILHLAPYYLALRSTVDDLAWSEDRFLRVTFNLPPASGLE